MKIAELKTYIVGNPPPHHGGRYFIFVKLTTACGIDGIGEVYAATFGPQTIVTMIEDVFARHVEGRNPLRIEALWRAVYGSGYSLRPDISLMGVLSGLEMACWDIAGKAADRPVHDLLGGKVRERLRTYNHHLRSSTGRKPSSRRSGRLSAIVPICCSAPMASSARRARSAWRGGWRPMTPYGLKSRCRRKCRRRWPRWHAPRRSRWRPASG
jgi:L-alanine-DL-glutamate epimerase-like enolase superfamily enzyme